MEYSMGCSSKAPLRWYSMTYSHGIVDVFRNMGRFVYAPKYSRPTTATSTPTKVINDNITIAGDGTSANPLRVSKIDGGDV